MSVWFAFSAVMRLPLGHWGLDQGAAGLILAALQLGYMLLVVPVGLLSDRYDPRTIMAAGAATAGLLTALLALWARGFWPAFLLRGLTGMAMAGVYTPGIRLLSSWFPTQRGLAIGLFVGAVDLGSASALLTGPLANAIGWRGVLLLVAVAAWTGALILWLAVPPTPDRTRRSAPLRLRAVLHPALLLANGGYMAHMWEIYAMWGWIGPFLDAVLRAKGLPAATALAWGDAGAFLIIAAGAPAALVAGRLSDRFGRIRVILVLLGTSSLISLFYGFLGGLPFWLLVLLGLVYGFAVAGDSPVFSVAITELGDPAYLGTALAVQSVLGYATTVFSTSAFGFVTARFGWGPAFAMLGVGAAGGLPLVSWLGRHAAARRLAGVGQQEGIGG